MNNTIGIMGMIGLGVAAFLLMRDKNSKVKKMKEEIKELVVLSNNVRDPIEMGRVTMRATVLCTSIMLEALAELKKNTQVNESSTVLYDDVTRSSREAYSKFSDYAEKILERLAKGPDPAPVEVIFGRGADEEPVP